MMWDKPEVYILLISSRLLPIMNSEGNKIKKISDEDKEIKEEGIKEPHPEQPKNEEII